MQNSRAKTIRGLSIAVVILSIISIIGLLIALVFIGLGGVALSDPEIRDYATTSIYVDPETSYEMERLGLTTDDAFGLMGFVLGLGVVYIIWGIICSIVTLISGIIGIRNCSNTAKLGGAFGWAIAGAVMAFLYGNIVTMALLIISAVCISRDRKDATAIPYGQPAAYTQTPGQAGYYAPPQQQGYAAPQQPYGAPQQGYAAPQQAAQPAQPAQPAQIEQPAQPAQQLPEQQGVNEDPKDGEQK